MSTRRGKATSEERLLSKLIQRTLFGFTDEQCEHTLRTVIGNYRESLYTYAYQQCGSYDVADDILQRAWLELYVELSQNGEDRVHISVIPIWLRTVIYHAAINYRKAQRRIISLDKSEGIWLLESCVSPFEYPDAVIARTETLEELGKTLSKLPAIQQRVILMRFSEEMKLEEIAQELGIPLNTVKSHLRRGLLQLRELLPKIGIRPQELQHWAGYKEVQNIKFSPLQSDNILTQSA